MGKKIVISFPGGRGYEIPLLYYGAKYFEDLGYEKLFLNHPVLEEEGFEAFSEALLINAKNVMESIDFSRYEEIVFVAKSIGTVVACKMKEMYQIPAKLILFTPINETLPYINGHNDILLVVAGTNDRHLNSNELKALCDEEDINCYIEPNVGHRMEVMNDLKRNLKIIWNVISQIS